VNYERNKKGVRFFETQCSLYVLCNPAVDMSSVIVGNVYLSSLLH